jgi:NAD(P)H-hydrate epimerase
MPKIVTIEEMIAIEKAADAAGHSYDDMMQFAGRALADHILQTIAQEMVEPNILLLVGPGNNGGDGLVAARCLAEDLGDIDIIVYLLKARKDDIFVAAQESGVSVVLSDDDAKADYEGLSEYVENATIIVDALFGTGTRLPIKGRAADILKHVQEVLDYRQSPDLSLNAPTQPLIFSDRPVIIAVDCPSGINCDTGELDPVTLHADSTVTFAAAKVGQFIFPGAAAVGELLIGDIGLPPKLKALDSIKLVLADGKLVHDLLPERSNDGHKGSFGKTMIVAGSSNFIGAAYLAGAAAYRSGTGLVTIGAPQVIIPSLATLLPEATWLLLPHELGVLHERAESVLRENIKGYSAILIGPGLGQDEATLKFINKLLHPDPDSPATKPAFGFQVIRAGESKEVDHTDEESELPPLVIDADGLNQLAKIDKWWKLLPKNTILTPHPTEFARLANLRPIKDNKSPAQQVQEDRLNLALKYAKKWKCIVVLKGAFTIVAQPNGHATIIPFATSALSTAGTGDVLAGLIVGLLAQGVAPENAAIVGAWLHGFAGIQAERAHGTPRSVIASDLLTHLPTALSIAEMST